MRISRPKTLPFLVFQGVEKPDFFRLHVHGSVWLEAFKVEMSPIFLREKNPQELGTLSRG